MRHELDLIARLKCESCFLTLHDIVAFRRRPAAACPFGNSETGGPDGVSRINPAIPGGLFPEFPANPANCGEIVKFVAKLWRPPLPLGQFSHARKGTSSWVRKPFKSPASAMSSSRGSMAIPSR